MDAKALIPQLRTTDLEASLRFYVQKLGFVVAFRYEDFYAGVRAGKQVFHLKRVDRRDPSIDEVARDGHFHLYFEVDDVEALAQDLRARGVALVNGPERKPWGAKEFVIRDDQGHTLYFGQA